ncbi:response regulator, partial [Candidatus Babeliales bacterium]|nr:response regulator [Candidatus Babeliales bacterium]
MLNVMIVDDEPIVRLSLKSSHDWKKHGFSCTHEAANGHQALELLRKNSGIDIVITDIKMPIMDGLSLIRHIQEENLDVKLIVLSAYDDFYLVRDAFKLGVQDYIIKTEMKPATVLAVLQNVARTMNSSEATADGAQDNQAVLQFPCDKQQLLKDLLTGTESTVDQGDFLHELHLDSGSILVCALLVDDFSGIEARYRDSSISDFSEIVRNGIRQVLIKRDSAEIICMSPDLYALVLAIQECD